ncbi:MAG: response regulator transcription factor [Ornithinimicrobium sp.]
MSIPLVHAVEKVAQATNLLLPILVLAEQLTEADEYRLLSSGARDVLSAPVAPTRLRMQILAMRRAAIGDAGATKHYTCGPMSIDVGRREVTIHGEEIDLTRSEFDLLVALARDPRRVVTREELCSTIGRPGNGKAVESHLSRLRKKVTTTSGSRLIEPVRGVGYRLGVVQSIQRVS